MKGSVQVNICVCVCIYIYMYNQYVLKSYRVGSTLALLRRQDYSEIHPKPLAALGSGYICLFFFSLKNIAEFD